MSDYDKRYNVHTDRVSYYTDNPETALKLYSRGRDPERSWISEGYAEESYYGREGFTCVTRRTTGKVLPSTLEFLVQRAAVQEMLERIR